MGLYLARPLGKRAHGLTEARDTAVYTATMEPGRQAVEQAPFSNIYDPVNTVVDKPSGFDALGDAEEDPGSGALDSITGQPTGNTKVARLNASLGKQTGRSLVLKVMKGDQV